MRIEMHHSESEAELVLRFKHEPARGFSKKTNRCDCNCQPFVYEETACRLVYVYWIFSRKIMLGEHVDERTALPDQLITQVNGTQIFGQEYPRVRQSIFTNTVDFFPIQIVQDVLNKKSNTRAHNCYDHFIDQLKLK